MKPQSRIQKGKDLENWVRGRLRASGLDTGAYRVPGSGSGNEKGDVGNCINLAIECKNTKALHAGEYWKQARRQSIGDYQKPVLVWKPPQTSMEESVVMIEWHHFESLLVKSKEPKLEKPDKEFKWAVSRMVNAAKEVMKHIKE